MKHIRNLWNLLKQEISLWKYEKQELVKGICYIVMIAWLFFDRIAFAILLIPYLFVFMKQQRIHKVHREKEKLRKEFREMMISIGNSLSAGYSIENALKTAKNDLEMYEEHSLLAKELQLLISKLKMNEPVDNLLFDMAAKQMEKKIMSVMPYFILLYVRISNPGYFDILYESFAGVLVAVISLLCLWIADIWAERVTEIEI